uniref:Charged multivesicular body protein 2b n=1 Tax=Strigamia maritima TaxID=126957 RepID=T1IY41_STRMM
MTDQIRENDKLMRRTQRDIEKERRELEKQEKQLELEIKKMAKQGNKQGCVMLAKQLVHIRKQKSRTYTAGSKVASASAQTRAMQSNAKMADAMATTAKTVSKVNKQMNPQKVMKTMQDFARESTKMEMTEETINDTLDDLLNDSGDEEEEDLIVQKVLDEIGIEISGKIAEAPDAVSGRLGESSKNSLPTDDEIERQLAQLRT